MRVLSREDAGKNLRQQGEKADRIFQYDIGSGLAEFVLQGMPGKNADRPGSGAFPHPHIHRMIAHHGGILRLRFQRPQGPDEVIGIGLDQWNIVPGKHEIAEITDFRKKFDHGGAAVAGNNRRFASVATQPLQEGYRSRKEPSPSGRIQFDAADDFMGLSVKRRTASGAEFSHLPCRCIDHFENMEMSKAVRWNTFSRYQVQDRPAHIRKINVQFGERTVEVEHDGTDR